MALGGAFEVSPPAFPWDLVIAVDSGGNFLFRHGIAARLVIGDLDSISAEALNWHVGKGAEVRRYPTDKDLTDFELGLCELPTEPANLVHLCGIWGGRLDHALMNLLVLARFNNRGLFTFDTEEGWGGAMGPGYLRLGLPGGMPVALIALSPTKGINSEGVQWPLKGGTLQIGEGRGISNLTQAPVWSLGFSEGCLLWLVRGMDRAAAGIEWHPEVPPIRGPAEGDQ